MLLCYCLLGVFKLCFCPNLSCLMGLCENDEQEHGRGGMSTFLSKLLAFRFTGS